MFDAIGKWGAAAFAALAAAMPAFADDAFPHWAYPVNPPGLAPAADDGTQHMVYDSAQRFTLTQIRDLFKAPDWHPQDHPAMPDVVAVGRKPNVYACGYCHLPNGAGRPENASLAGLPASYIVQQVADFKSGARKSSEADSLPVNLMIAVAKAVSDEDLKAAADYFSALRPQPTVRVIQSPEVPKTHVQGWMLVRNDPPQMEAIGQRIIEFPDYLENTELRDPRSTYLAIAPPGSFGRGDELARGASGGMPACTTCHGPGLRGLGPVPALAGRSPSYLFRQLYDFKHALRRGPWSPLMQQVIAGLSEFDMIALAAYVASLEP